MNVLQKIHLTDETEDILYAPTDNFHTWVNNRLFPHKVGFGNIQYPIQIKPHPDRKQQYMLSKSLSDKLFLPRECAHHIFEKENVICIGPVVGIYTAGFTGHTIRPVGERSIIFAKLLSSARKLGVTAYLFGSHHIDWDSGHINGYTYDRNGWSKVKMPFPNVIYDRLPNRKVEQLTTSMQTKKKFQQLHSILWFNPGFFDKWKIHRLLSEDTLVNAHLPETCLSPGLNTIKQLLDQYQSVYLKPTNGSLGMGIQQILKKKGDLYYYCRFRTGTSNRLRRYSSLKRLLQKQFPNGTNAFMAQRGINLLNWNGNSIDFRVHTNRGRSGKWQISAIAAKLAGSGSVTTHVTSGGRIISLPELINEMEKSRSMIKEIQATALQLSEALSEKIEGIVGEIGFDLGFDEDGAIWMFEANAKPGRSIFSHPNLKAYDKKTQTLPFEYAIHLYEQGTTPSISVKND